jgi:nitrogen-specific signal transduction histidine kinase
MQKDRVSEEIRPRGIEHEIMVSQACFIGKILSIFTHEIKNHLAVIKESSGLMEDLIEFGKSRPKQDLNQFLEISSSIHNQVRKTMSLLNYLNRFSHRFDHEMCTFNLNESLEELLALIQRMVNQKRITINKEFEQNMPLVQSNPSHLQLLVFSLLEERIKKLDDRSSISIRTSHSKGKITISILTHGDMTHRSEKMPLCSRELLQDLTLNLGWSITEKENDSSTAIVIPVSPTLHPEKKGCRV